MESGSPVQRQQPICDQNDVIEVAHALILSIAKEKNLPANLPVSINIYGWTKFETLIQLGGKLQ